MDYRSGSTVPQTVTAEVVAYPDDQPMTLSVNGVEQAVRARPDTPLLYILRNHLGLKGTRFGCGTGYCGACTVIVDGRALTSCDMPVSAVIGRRVRTIDGLASEGQLHPLQRAFVEDAAGQCGYCLSGIVMAALAFLEEHPAPAAGDVRAALEPNICRCGAHDRMVRAVCRAALEMA